MLCLRPWELAQSIKDSFFFDSSIKLLIILSGKKGVSHGNVAIHEHLLKFSFAHFIAVSIPTRGPSCPSMQSLTVVKLFLKKNSLSWLVIIITLFKYFFTLSIVCSISFYYWTQERVYPCPFFLIVLQQGWLRVYCVRS